MISPIRFVPSSLIFSPLFLSNRAKGLRGPLLAPTAGNNDICSLRHVIGALNTPVARWQSLETEMIVVLDHPPSGVVYNFGCVCLSVCQTITFESLDVGSSYLHMRHYGSSSYMKVIVGSRSRSQEPKWWKIPIPTFATMSNFDRQ